MKQFQAKITSNKKITEDHYRLSFKMPGAKRKINPGQFFNIRISNAYVPLLRRPFSAHKIEESSVEILYKIVGKATQILSNKKAGDNLNILGPLGNGFDIRPSVGRRKPVGILIAGGHGVAPLYALAKRLKDHNIKLAIFIGARTKKHVICESDFKKLGAEVHVSTEDGTKGHKGMVTELLSRKLKTYRVLPSTSSRRRMHEAERFVASLYACGPNPMLERVAEISGQAGIPCQVSLEEYMACGIGTCLGCAVKTKTGYKLVCKDGPVFDSKEIAWDNKKDDIERQNDKSNG